MHHILFFAVDGVRWTLFPFFEETISEFDEKRLTNSAGRFLLNKQTLVFRRDRKVFFFGNDIEVGMFFGWIKELPSCQLLYHCLFFLSS